MLRNPSLNSTARVCSTTLLVAGLCFGLAWSQVAIAQTASDHRADRARAEALHVAAVEELETALRTFQRGSAEIERIKESLQTPLDIIELRSALREAQRGAEALARLDEQARLTRASVEQHTASLIAALRSEVAGLDGALRAAPPHERRALVDRLNALNAEIGRLSAPLPRYTPVPIEAIIAGIGGTTEELYDAAAELSDHESRLERQLQEVRERIRVDALSARVTGASARFSVEESLLDDESGRRVGPRRVATGGARASTDETGAAQADSETSAGGRPSSDDSPLGAGAAGGSPEAAPAPRDEPSGHGAVDDADFSAGGPQVVGGRGPDGASEFGAAPLTAPPAIAIPFLPARVADEPGASVPAAPVEQSERAQRRTVGEGLRAREEQLRRQLEDVRRERERLLRHAAALELAE